nr:amidase [Rhizobiaceae bacterium]
MTETPPNGLSASEAIQKIQEGWLSCVDLATACLDQIELTEPQLNAWAHRDRDRVLSQAEKLDDIRRQGKPIGRLHGIPIGLKDIIDTADFPTERGSPIFKGRQPSEDARIVQRLREEGAILLGKTATTELAFVHPCSTCNPHNPAHTPGGSSSGSAAAVAGYHTPLSIGTQTNGSVIRPASYCGTYGFKPTRGIIPRTGVLQTSKSLDQIGVFGRSLEDVALLAEVLGCYDPADEKSYARPRPQMVESMNCEPPADPDIAWL